ncbi:MAG: hypothetical protein RLZZ303_3635 [Candidatus Hydrogenedentota bacterium]
MGPNIPRPSGTPFKGGHKASVSTMSPFEGGGAPERAEGATGDVLRRHPRAPRFRPANDPKAGRRGVALMLVLLFIVLLTVLVVDFAYDAQVDASLASNQDSRFEATLAAKSAIAQSMSMLAEDVDPESIAEMEALVGVDTGGANDAQYDVGLIEYGSGETWAIGVPFEPQNNATRRATVSDEYGKINLNALVYHDEESDEMIRNEPLIAALGFFFAARTDTEDANALVDPIIDWLDYNDDDEEEPEGAENSYYEGLETPYRCKNGPMDSIEELFLIKGMTPELYWGDSTLDPPQLPLSEYLTVHGAPNGAVNINSAQLDVLSAIVQGYSEAGNYSFTAELQPPYTSYSQLQQVMQPPQQNRRNRRNRNQDINGDGVVDERDQQANAQGGTPPFITWSNAFRIYGDGQMDDTLVRIEAYVWRNPYPEDRYLLETLTDAQERKLSEILANAEVASGRAPEEFEQFRILDWKVIQ